MHVCVWCNVECVGRRPACTACGHSHRWAPPPDVRSLVSTRSGSHKHAAHAAARRGCIQYNVHEHVTRTKRTQREHESTSRAPRLLAATESMYLPSCRPWGRGRCCCTPPGCLLRLGDRELPAAGCGARSACFRSTSPPPGHTSPLLPAGSTNLVLSAALGAVCCSSMLPG